MRLQSALIIPAIACLIVLLPQTGLGDVKPSRAMLAPIYAFASGAASANSAVLSTVCVSDVTIVDEFAPFEWSGPGAARRYAAGVQADYLKDNVRDTQVAIEDPRYFDVKGGMAWASVPATFSYLFAGKRTSEVGMFAFVLVKSGDAWKVKSSSWAITSFATVR